MKTAGPLSLGKGLIGKLLFGAGEKAIPAASRIVSSTGRVMESALGKSPKFLEAIRGKQLGTWARHTFIGRSPIKVLGQRIRQGGILGKGGLLRSTVAMPEELAKSVAQHGYLKGMLRNPGHALGWGVGTGLVAGFPAYGVYQDISAGNYSHIPKTLLSGATWAIADPFSMVAQIPVLMGAEAALDKGVDVATKKIKKMFTPKFPKPPSIPKMPKIPSIPKLPEISPYSYT